MAGQRDARQVLRFAVWAVGAFLVTGFLVSIPDVGHLFAFAPSWRGWIGGAAMTWAFVTTGAYLIHFFWRLVFHRISLPETADPTRRRLLNAAGSALAAAPLAITGFGVFIQRTAFGVREVDVPIPNLPRDLRNLRLVQITDVHLGAFLSERELARVIDAANELHPHLALMTGDLISMRGDPLDTCLAQLARLRSDSGIWGCLGNHEVYVDCERYTTQKGAGLGIGFLRAESRALRFGDATLNLAGVDYQSVAHKDRYLQGAERLLQPGAVNVLLSHNPDVFDIAARQGFDLTVAGHTHGGQVTIEILHQTLNVARFITPYVYGLYGLDHTALYVSRGIGTIGLPVRIGAPPEISLLRLVSA